MTLWRTLFGFDGRIGRAVFWLSLTAVALLDMAVVALISDWVHARYMAAQALGQAPGPTGGALVGVGLGFLGVAAASAWIGLALKIKRAHDVGHSGWRLLIALVPVYGPIRLLIDLGFRPGSRRRNRFGPPVGHLGDLDDPAPDLYSPPKADAAPGVPPAESGGGWGAAPPADVS